MFLRQTHCAVYLSALADVLAVSVFASGTRRVLFFYQRRAAISISSGGGTCECRSIWNDPGTVLALSAAVSVSEASRAVNIVCLCFCCVFSGSNQSTGFFWMSLRSAESFTCVCIFLDLGFQLQLWLHSKPSVNLNLLDIFKCVQIVFRSHTVNHLAH